jgi:hypothetical protein
MGAKVCCTGAVLLLAIGAFCGFGPVDAGLLNPMGFLLIGFAVLVWRGWDAITGMFSPALIDGMVQRGPKSTSEGPVVPEIYPDKLGRSP